MKPLNLKMYGVGPYATEIEIDFSKLNENGLFLITGATGAGKTSIFDGITYALYGEANLKDDDKKNGIICDYIANENHKDAYVKFTFEVDGSEYSVKRIPAHYKYKKNGERNKTKIGETFEIETDLKKSIPGKKEDRDKYIKEEVLKLDAAQFKQLIMLPQGAFNEFIRSNSNNKEKTLEKIFDTNIYKSITEKLKKKVEDLTGKKTEVKNNIFAELNTLNIDDERWKGLLKTKTLAFDELLEIIEDRKSELEEETKVIKTEINNIDQDKITTNLAKSKIINISVIELQEAKKSIEELNKQSRSIEGKKEELKMFNQANDIKVEYASKIKGSEDYKNKNNQYKKSLEEFEEYNKINDLKIESLDSSTKDLDILKDRVSTLDILKEDIKIYNELLKKIENDGNRLKKLEGKDLLQKEDLEEQGLLKQKKLKVERTKIEADINKGTKLSLEQEECKNKGVVLKDIVERYENISKDEKDLEKKNITLKGLIFQEKAEFNIYEKQSKLWFQSEAYNLVGQLEDKKPCPVCGSLDHPAKAKKPEDVPTEKELKKYEKNYKEIGSKKDKLIGEIKNSEYSIIKQNNELEKKLKEEDLENNYEELKKLNRENLDRVKKIKDELKNIYIEEDLKKIEETEIINSENIDRIKDEKIELLEEIRSLKNKYDNESKESITIKNKFEKKDINILTFEADYKKKIEEKTNKELEIKKIERLKEDRRTMETTLLEKLENLEGLEKRMKEANKLFEEKLQEKNFSSEIEYLKAEKINGKDLEEEIRSHSDNLIRVRTIIDGKKGYEGIELIDIKVLEEEKKLAESKIKELNSKTSEKTAEVSQLDIKKKHLKNIDEKNKREEKVLNIYTKLLGIAEGKYGEKRNKITFQNYVLGVYFEEVLDRANERFTKMTNNQYQMILYRNQEPEKGKGKGKAGLDINVFDSHTGKERSIKTLSGGETFKASMALALGLSDVVQSQNGGIQLDSVFIDEGFGTLDEESLSTAMDILMELKSNGRTVGIISHVNELKQTITSQIRVEKTSRGSSVEVII